MTSIISNNIMNYSLLQEIIQVLQSSHPIIRICLVVGIIITTIFLHKIITSFYKTFVRSGTKHLRQYKGTWAVITGATDGIGKAYAIALSQHGINILLISRTESKLIEVQQEILNITKKNKNTNTVQVQYIVCDYSNFTTTIQNDIASKLQNLDIGILINNVGMSYKYPMYFTELSNTDIEQLIQMNIYSTVYMTKMILPGMMQRKRGMIVNISSGSALYTLPLLAIYSGCKSFIEKFTRALHMEYYKTYNISCQCQVPFYVATKLAKLRPSISVPTPKQYVNMAINWIGYPNDIIVSPFYIHAIQGYIMYYIPEFILSNIIRNMHLSIRKRGIQKDTNNNKKIQQSTNETQQQMKMK